MIYSKDLVASSLNELAAGWAQEINLVSDVEILETDKNPQKNASFLW